MPDKHVLDVEQLNYTLEDRFRVKYYRLPFNVMPGVTICYQVMSIPSNRNKFVKKDGVSWYYSPHMIVNKSMIDYKKHLLYSFGTYGQASVVNKPKSNDNRARTICAIYLRPSSSLKGAKTSWIWASGRVVIHTK